MSIESKAVRELRECLAGRSMPIQSLKAGVESVLAELAACQKERDAFAEELIVCNKRVGVLSQECGKRVPVSELEPTIRWLYALKCRLNSNMTVTVDGSGMDEELARLESLRGK
jgi:hypothetical protein